MGNLYELDYQKHYEHVKDASPDLGKFLNFEEQPKDPAALQ